MRLCPSCRHPWSEHTIGKGDHVQFGCYHGAMDGGPKTCPCERSRPKVSAWRPLLALALASIACGGSPLEPTPVLDPAARIIWEKLMLDLVSHRMSGADPSNTRGVSVQVEPAMGDGEEIYYPGGGLVRGYTVGTVIHVYEGWEWKRRGSRVVRHEFAHVHCQLVLGHPCANPVNTAAGHRFTMPDGVDLWSVVD